MNIFSLTQEIAIDLGTANTIIICDGKIVVDEPSVVAIRKSDDKMIAVGKKASPMQDRGESKIYTVRPLRKGVIADYKACEMMIRGLINLIPQRRHFLNPAIRMVVCVPSGATDAEIRIINDSCTQAGARELYLIYEPMAAALGMGFDIEGPEGCMVVDIGGGTTEIAVMALGSLVVNKSIPIAGDALNQDIVQYMHSGHGMRISEPTAERIKKQVGSALVELDNPPEDMVVVGPNKTNDLPLHVPVSYQEIAHCLDKNISNIETAIMQALGDTPSELYADIVERGIFLTGGGALLHGLAERLTNKTTITFHVADDPLHSVANGTGIALKNLKNLSFLIDGIR
ncbi:MAG: rod shape-determining protein [Paludibacteraceae bacterium]|nr:rod shape-determining protein [Paludibacteraceae bacterium]